MALLLTTAVLLAVRIGVATYELANPPKASSEITWLTPEQLWAIGGEDKVAAKELDKVASGDLREEPKSPRDESSGASSDPTFQKVESAAPSFQRPDEGLPSTFGTPTAQDNPSAPPNKLFPNRSYMDKPILFDFSAKWCTPCKQLEENALCNKDVVALVKETFVPVKVVDRKREDGQNSKLVQKLEDKYEITRFPTLAICLADGTWVTYWDGQQKPSELKRHLEDGVKLCKYTIGKELALEGKNSEAADQFLDFIKTCDWKHWRSSYCATMGYENLLLANREKEAKELIETALEKVDKDQWPYPLIKYSAGEFNYDQLLRKTEDGKGERVSMHENVAAVAFAKKDYALAKEHLQWLIENSPKNWYEYRSARALLKRIPPGK